MKIKSLLIGSAAAVVTVSTAQAADIIIPEPEVVEYVRVCDAAGTGYFYIPGTETCLRISGYVRYEMNFTDDGNDGEFAIGPRYRPRADLTTGEVSDTTTAHVDGDGDWGPRSDVRLQFEAWNDTELGGLYSRIRLGYDSRPSQDGDNDASGFSIDHAYFTLAGLMIGKNASWWDWGYGADGDGLVDFGPGDVGMIAYTVNAGGFGWTLALEEDESGNYVPDILLDVDGSVGDFSVRAGVAYNESEEAFSVKARAGFDFGIASVQLGVQYSEDDNLGADYLADYEWVFGGDASADLTDKLSARVGFNYGLDDAAGNDGWTVGAGVNYEVVSGFDIDARVNYVDTNAAGDDGDFGGRIRLTRSF